MSFDFEVISVFFQKLGQAETYVGGYIPQGILLENILVLWQLIRVRSWNNFDAFSLDQDFDSVFALDIGLVSFQDHLQVLIVLLLLTAESTLPCCLAQLLDFLVVLSEKFSIYDGALDYHWEPVKIRLLTENRFTNHSGVS